MIRAVSDDAALIGGPNHGNRNGRVEFREDLDQAAARGIEPAEQLRAS